MKPLLIFIPFLTFIFFNASAQSGIYKTPDDYENGKLSFQQQENEQTVIRTDIAFNSSMVKVVESGERHHFQKSDLYGFRNKKNQDFRFYHDRNYKIEDPKFFMLYSREENVMQGKARIRKTKYYFSKDVDSPILELTIRNLKYAFPFSPQFHDLIDLQFRRDSELTRFDSFRNEYKLKSVFDLAMR